MTQSNRAIRNSEGHKTMKVRKIVTASALVCLGVATLAGCRSEEQGRITHYQPGVYQGRQDQKLTDEQQRLLRGRTLMQGGATDVASGGGSRDVRKPGVDADTLKQRTQNQKGS
jgi:hypothetical protein